MKNFVYIFPVPELRAFHVNATNGNNTVNNGMNPGSLEEIKPLRSKSGNFIHI